MDFQVGDLIRHHSPTGDEGIILSSPDKSNYNYVLVLWHDRAGVFHTNRHFYRCSVTMNYLKRDYQCVP